MIDYRRNGSQSAPDALEGLGLVVADSDDLEAIAIEELIAT